MNPADVLNKARSTANFTDQEKNLMIGALQEVRRIVVANRILIKPSFQDFDRANTCHVTDQ